MPRDEWRRETDRIIARSGEFDAYYENYMMRFDWAYAAEARAEQLQQDQRDRIEKQSHAHTLVMNVLRSMLKNHRPVFQSHLEQQTCVSYGEFSEETYGYTRFPVLLDDMRVKGLIETVYDQSQGDRQVRLGKYNPGKSGRKKHRVEANPKRGNHLQRQQPFQQKTGRAGTGARTVSASPATEKGIQLVLTALSAVGGDSDFVCLSLLKEVILKSHPAFRESKYGYGGFKLLLEGMRRKLSLTFGTIAAFRPGRCAEGKNRSVSRTRRVRNSQIRRGGADVPAPTRTAPARANSEKQSA